MIVFNLASEPEHQHQSNSWRKTNAENIHLSIGNVHDSPLIFFIAKQFLLFSSCRVQT